MRRLEFLVEPAFGLISAWLLWFQLNNIAHNVASDDTCYVVRTSEDAVWNGLSSNLVTLRLVTHSVEVVGETGHETGLSGTFWGEGIV